MSDILTTRVKAGLLQRDMAEAFGVDRATFSKHERRNSPLYIHATNGYAWSKDPLAFIKTMVKAGKCPPCMIEAYQSWYAENA